ncbi:Hypothetical protein RG1141_CH07810 [Neorhizobium galegae bv. officinalis bv. officinalis str. HAMBI 1141]|uniref:Uncharacterized protein n=1 Tax=Neorhizobium galegae bv. officinalis bv. officinalis str. HAMBI 1141 TaxID=1028801 RepID=A0A068T510_NEOGA|nr:hypothetical protein [Neorhizobium galegae]CDN53141.1 Hypothetical protein RG1141_CH07810 [Neorhizobium galegae bv. officinalis bv. officinalis str. HAMBI 1141]
MDDDDPLEAWLDRSESPEERAKRLAALDAALARGIADAEAGRGKPAEEVLAYFEAKYRKLSEERAKSGRSEMD